MMPYEAGAPAAPAPAPSRQKSLSHKPLRKLATPVTPLNLPLSPWFPGTGLTSPTSPGAQNDTVSIRDAADGSGRELRGSASKEIYISCCDALGLGCLVARVFADFGLRIVSCDFSTDGRFCFIMFKVEPTPSCCEPRRLPLDWDFLKRTLQDICPADTMGALYFKPNISNLNKNPLYHIMTVKCKDRRGLIHWLISTFWKFSYTIHRLKCVTNPDDQVIDEFYISSMREHNSGLLLGDGGALESASDNLEDLEDYISEKLEAEVTTRSIHDEYDTSVRKTRRLSYGGPGTGGESSSQLNLARLSQGAGGLPRPTIALSPYLDAMSEPLLSRENSPFSSCIDLAHASNFSESVKTYCKDVSVEVDNSTSSENTILRCVCPDRKGILYDFFRLLSDVQLRASYGRVATNASTCEALVFVKESKTGGQIHDPQVQDKLKDLIFSAIARPFELYLTASSKAEELMELKVVAPVDTSGRGRPKVIYDVTSALNSLKVMIVEAEMYVCGSLKDINQKETHIFHIIGCDNTPIKKELQERIYESVFCQLMGVMRTKRNNFVSYYPAEEETFGCCEWPWLSRLSNFIFGAKRRNNDYVSAPSF